MNGARATLKNAPLSAQKARLIADLVRNLPVERAQDILYYNPKAGAKLVRKLLASAVANANDLAANEKWHGGGELDSTRLFIKQIFVNEGLTLKRIRPRARGMAYGILRRSCHITLEVDDRK